MAHSLLEYNVPVDTMCVNLRSSSPGYININRNGSLGFLYKKNLYELFFRDMIIIFVAIILY